jgi:hypothetical protein
MPPSSHRSSHRIAVVFNLARWRCVAVFESCCVLSCEVGVISVQGKLQLKVVLRCMPASLQQDELQALLTTEVPWLDWSGTFVYFVPGKSRFVFYCALLRVIRSVVPRAWSCAGRVVRKPSVFVCDVSQRRL